MCLVLFLTVCVCVCVCMCVCGFGGCTDIQPFMEYQRPKVRDRETEYQSKWREQMLSPARADPFAVCAFLV